MAVGWKHWVKKTNTDNRNAAPAAGRKATRQVCFTVDLQSANCFLTSPCILFLTSGPSCEQRGGNRGDLVHPPDLYVAVGIRSEN